MVNYRVENLEWLLTQLKAESVEIVGELMVKEYGKFAHILDPEGNKIEL
jgi:predicted enzyme related to lactoylglutathione lyase